MKNKVFGFLSKIANRKKTLESQKSVLKYVDMLGDDRQYVEYVCPYCKVQKSKDEKALKKLQETNPNASTFVTTIFTTGDKIDFAEHLASKHHLDATTARVIAEMAYIDAASQDLV